MMKKVSFLVMAVMFWMASAANAQQLPSGNTLKNSNTGSVFGDLNNDGEVNLSDMNVLVHIILGGQYTPPDPYTPNMTLAEFKAKHWQDDVFYVDTITEDEVIHGWVVSSDKSGNIYKALYIMDESGTGLTISVNKNALYRDFPIGQEIVLPMKGYCVGKYCGQQQIGSPSFYAQQDVWEITFMPAEQWDQLVVVKGNPVPECVEPIELSIADLAGHTDRETLLRYQGALVRLSGVTFAEADGVTTFAESFATTNRSITDAEGNTLIVRNSNYADFAGNVLPSGEVSVTGVLSFYASRNGAGGTWQIYLRDINDVVANDDSGTLTNPYTVAEAIAAQDSGIEGWVSGFVVGAVAPEVTTVKSNADIEWKAPTTLGNTLVLADDPNVKDYTKCVIVPLPQGSSFRSEANLKDNPALYQMEIMVKGEISSFMGATGIINDGEQYRLPTLPVMLLVEDFETSLPDNWRSLTVSGDKNWYQSVFANNGYAAATGYRGTQPPFEMWLITPPLDIKHAASKVLNFRTQVNGYGSTTSKFEVFLLNSDDPVTATVRVKLNPTIATAPSSGYSNWVESGDLDLSQWADGCYYIGFCYSATQDNNYATWCLDDVKFGD